jgi:hypothetical protein
MKQNQDQRNFRVFGPEETASNRLDALCEATERTWVADRRPEDEHLHVIGEAAVGSPPATNVQTTMVPAGGAAIVEFKLDVPGRYILVDHSLSRLERGLAGFLVVEGDADPAVFHGANGTNMSGH